MAIGGLSTYDGEPIPPDDVIVRAVEIPLAV